MPGQCPLRRQRGSIFVVRARFDSPETVPAGLASTALVLSIAAPFGGNLWYGLTSFSPFAGVYYLQKGDRQEEVRSAVLPVTSRYSWQVTASHLYTQSFGVDGS